MTGLLRRAGWWLLDYAYACYWQLRGLLGRTDPADFRTGDERPVLVIPGIWEAWTFLRPLVEPLHAAGHPVHVVSSLRRNGRPVVDSARLVSQYLKERDLRDVVIVAHSKGGLIGKYVMAELDPEQRVTRMIAIATPFAGSRYAPYLVLSSLRAFSPRDPTTLKLIENVLVNARITSVWGVFDPHIPGGSRLPGASNIELGTGGHFRIIATPAVREQVLAAAHDPVSTQ